MTDGVLFLHSSAGLYGADRQLLLLASGLDRARYTPLVALPERGELSGGLERAGVETVTAPLAVLRRAELNPAGLTALARASRAAERALAPLARERGVRLIHSNTSVVLTGARLARRLGLPHLMHVRELYPRPPLLWPLLRRRIASADRLACVSESVARQFDGAGAVTVVHDGLPAPPERADRRAARERLGVEPGAFAVAVLGRISDWKGQDVLARALAEPPLRDVGAVGLVAGSPWPGAEGPALELDRLAAELGLGPRLRTLGFVGERGLVLGAADAVAVPSTRPDPFPNSALEAAAAGVPVVAASHGGLPEMLRDGETGVLVPPGDHAALARALRALADDPAAAERMGRAAARDVAVRFSPERMLDEVQRAYAELL